MSRARDLEVLNALANALSHSLDLERALHLPLYTVGALVSLAIERTRLAAAGAKLAETEERNRLARDIHDTIAQSLAAVAMFLEAADSSAGTQGDEPTATAIRKALLLTRSTLE